MITSRFEVHALYVHITSATAIRVTRDRDSCSGHPIIIFTTNPYLAGVLGDTLAYKYSCPFTFVRTVDLAQCWCVESADQRVFAGEGGHFC